ncbi:MAG: hypothetical protein H7144_02330, partial [Burkholderiales bacterium]|nr:hypothetical protein [Phycisphaerae bacterium]
MSDPTRLDPLTAAARTVLRIDIESAFTTLVPREPGSRAAADLLHALSPADLVQGAVKSPDDAAALLSGLWLWHDYLDESHNISQQIQTESGSFW